MNPEHARYADWDAAYVLGALSADDRREFEAHLEACPDCRRGVAELAPTVALLSRVTVGTVEAMSEEDDLAAESAARAQLLSLDRARSRRRRRTWWIGAVAAAALVIAAVGTPVTIAALNRPTASFALQDVGDVALKASVDLKSVAWGTRIDLDCRYPAGSWEGVPREGWTYVLAIVGTDGSTSSVSTWRAGPGTTSRLSAGTALDVDAIRSVEIRTTSGAVLMRYDLAETG
ncbi:MAG: zf-HC2 domain-containing protein [Microbacterium sp.]|uniref:anti-sigma factor family protein n=1 Tax=Microbacterium sp. TaxID=51671 RepID=UPI001ACA9E1A|nr:zf-HC2 domain-containing protein [Microbacterium sp.]MBN9153176.1 zf-HC2 domain-containing protein [Microbacterium sp.]MBN9171893.1 zf-HC2 domain-containing protein [Microbacterium sp.]MBN9172623.1 zf-HC2 domain-containing protein [Microbacterium sp.]